MNKYGAVSLSAHSGKGSAVMKTSVTARTVLCLLLTLLTAALPAARFAAFGAETTGTYYIDAENGNDGNQGTSPAFAWKTLARAAEHEFAAGERLLLNRGGTYEYTKRFYVSGGGEEGDPAVISAYGEGARPVIAARGADACFYLTGVSHWVLEELEFTSVSSGGCLVISAENGTDARDITVRDCLIRNIGPGTAYFGSLAVFIGCDNSEARVHDVCFKNVEIRDVENGIYVLGAGGPTFYTVLFSGDFLFEDMDIHNVAGHAVKLFCVDDCTFRNSRIDGCANGIETVGANRESLTDLFVSPEASYAQNLLLEGLIIRNATHDGIVLASVRNATVRNCRILNCATTSVGAHAPAWTHHVDRVVFEYCEIAGATNPQDGMAVDFDGWTTNSEYRYIYSHDNRRFMRNCVYDAETKNAGNSVHHCVSVNDSKGFSYAASALVSAAAPSFSWMDDFSFHDNMIVNGSLILWSNVTRLKTENNVYKSNAIFTAIQKMVNFFSGVRGFRYTLDASAQKAAIREITDRLPPLPDD